MPDYVLRDGRHYVSYVPGPSHTLLGVKFRATPCTVKMIKHPPVAQSPAEQLDAQRIAEAVEEVLAEFRSQGAQLYAEEIAYIEDDTPRYSAYKMAAYLLARQYANGLPFTQTPS
jgi:hypothetical protein